MSYLSNEKRFFKNSNGIEFHFHLQRTGEIGDYFFFAGLKGLLGKEGIFEPDPKEGRSFFTGFYRINRK